MVLRYVPLKAAQAAPTLLAGAAARNNNDDDEEGTPVVMRAGQDKKSGKGAEGAKSRGKINPFAALMGGESD
jgi:hypothetical protein